MPSYWLDVGPPAPRPFVPMPNRDSGRQVGGGVLGKAGIDL